MNNIKKINIEGIYGNIVKDINIDEIDFNSINKYNTKKRTNNKNKINITTNFDMEKIEYENSIIPKINYGTQESDIYAEKITNMTDWIKIKHKPKNSNKYYYGNTFEGQIINDNIEIGNENNNELEWAIPFDKSKVKYYLFLLRDSLIDNTFEDRWIVITKEEMKKHSEYNGTYNYHQNYVYAYKTMKNPNGFSEKTQEYYDGPNYDQIIYNRNYDIHDGTVYPDPQIALNYMKKDGTYVTDTTILNNIFTSTTTMIYSQIYGTLGISEGSVYVKYTDDIKLTTPLNGIIYNNQTMINENIIEFNTNNLENIEYFINFPKETLCDILIVAGGGSGGVRDSGAGGAGGVLLLENQYIKKAIVKIGKGGNSVQNNNHVGGNKGEDSIISIIDDNNNIIETYITEGGGKGGKWNESNNNSTGNGGSGGGGGGNNSASGIGKQSTSLSGGFGNNGGNGGLGGGGGGGGGGTGTNHIGDTGGNGGIGMDFSYIFGKEYGENGWFGGGGGIGSGTGANGLGGQGGGGNGANSGVAEGGMDGTGGGGGGHMNSGGTSGKGGNGIVLIKYKKSELNYIEKKKYIIPKEPIIKFKNLQKYPQTEPIGLPTTNDDIAQQSFDFDLSNIYDVNNYSTYMNGVYLSETLINNDTIVGFSQSINSKIFEFRALLSGSASEAGYGQGGKFYNLFIDDTTDINDYYHIKHEVFITNVNKNEYNVNAFNNNDKTYLEDGTYYQGLWIEIGISHKIIMNKYSWSMGNITSYISPKKWLICGSNDRKIWTAIHYNEYDDDYINDTSLSEYEFDNFINNRPFKYYRFIINKVFEIGLMLASWKIYGSDYIEKKTINNYKYLQLNNDNNYEIEFNDKTDCDILLISNNKINYLENIILEGKYDLLVSDTESKINNIDNSFILSSENGELLEEGKINNIKNNNELFINKKIILRYKTNYLDSLIDGNILNSHKYKFIHTNTVSNHTTYQFKLDKDSECEILLVGGGGGGGEYGGGGGGGDVIYFENILLKSGEYNIIVGEGGNGGGSGSNYEKGYNGYFSKLYYNNNNYITAGGGGGGNSYAEKALDPEIYIYKYNNIIYNSQGGGGGAASIEESDNNRHLGNNSLYSGNGGKGISIYGGGGGGGRENNIIANGGNKIKNIAGNGGLGYLIDIDDFNIGYGGGGGGGTWDKNTANSNGGEGKYGGGNGGRENGRYATNGINNRGGGGGGGGGGNQRNGMKGGSGIVIIKIKTNKIILKSTNNVKNKYLEFNLIGSENRVFSNNGLSTIKWYLNYNKLIKNINDERLYPPLKSKNNNFTKIDGISPDYYNVTDCEYGNGLYKIEYSSYYHDMNENPNNIFVKGENNGKWAENNYTNGLYNGVENLVNDNFKGDWIKIRLPLKIIPTKIIFSSINLDINEINKLPRKYRLYGSNNEIDWDIILNEDNIEIKDNYDDINNIAHIKNINTSNSYNIFALVINKIGIDENILAMSNFDIYGYEIDNSEIIYFKYQDNLDINQTQYNLLLDNTVKCDILLIGGGGGGGKSCGSGGGGGGLVILKDIILNKGNHEILVGKGGNGASSVIEPGNNGYNTQIDKYIAYGGGAGNGQTYVYNQTGTEIGQGGFNGGSGGGGTRYKNNGGKGQTGQGFDGGEGSSESPLMGGGGGGAGEIGKDEGEGGNGLYEKENLNFKKHFNITNKVIGHHFNNNVWFSAGGGGEEDNETVKKGGYGGGGGTNDINGKENTGGGGGGSGGDGGSGILIIKIKENLNIDENIEEIEYYYKQERTATNTYTITNLDELTDINKVNINFNNGKTSVNTDQNLEAILLEKGKYRVTYYQGYQPTNGTDQITIYPCLYDNNDNEWFFNHEIKPLVRGIGAQRGSQSYHHQGSVIVPDILEYNFILEKETAILIFTTGTTGWHNTYGNYNNDREIELYETYFKSQYGNVGFPGNDSTWAYYAWQGSSRNEIKIKKLINTVEDIKLNPQWNYYNTYIYNNQFDNGSGYTEYILNIDNEVICDILIVGGGGSGGKGTQESSVPGGGGGGGIVYLKNKILIKGKYKIYVGKGGDNSNGYSSKITNFDDDVILELDNIFLEGKGGGLGGTSTNGEDTKNGFSGSSTGGGNHLSGSWRDSKQATQGYTFWDGTKYILAGYKGDSNTVLGRGHNGNGGGGAGGNAKEVIGGSGLSVNIRGLLEYFGGGGGGSGEDGGGEGGIGGGGNGAISINQYGDDGIENTGGGGGGSYSESLDGGKGGSGIVIINYKNIEEIDKLDIKIYDENNNIVKNNNLKLTNDVKYKTKYDRITQIKEYNFDQLSEERLYPSYIIRQNIFSENFEITDKLYGNGIYSISWSSSYSIYDLPLNIFNINNRISKWQDNNYTNVIGLSLLLSAARSNYNGTNYIKNDYKGDWIKITLPYKILLTKYLLAYYNSNVNGTYNNEAVYNFPHDYRIYGSNDNFNWKLIIEKNINRLDLNDVYDNVNNEISAYKHVITDNERLTNYELFSSYALVVNKIGGGSFLNISTWDIYGKEYDNLLSSKPTNLPIKSNFNFTSLVKVLKDDINFNLNRFKNLNFSDFYENNIIKSNNENIPTSGKISFSNFIGTNTNIISLPFTEDLLAHYTSEGPFIFNGNNITQWNDLSINGNNITNYRGTPIIRTFTKGSKGLNGNDTIDIVYGDENSGFEMPFAMPDNYTFCYMARYVGDKDNTTYNKRIFDSRSNSTNTIGQNTLWGFHGNVAGRSHNGEKGWHTSTNYKQSDPDYWMIGIDTKNTARFNGLDSVNYYINGSTSYPRDISTGYNPTLSINFGYYTGQDRNTEISRWEIAEMIFYNKELNTDEKKEVEEYLSNKYQHISFSNVISTLHDFKSLSQTGLYDLWQFTYDGFTYYYGSDTNKYYGPLNHDFSIFKSSNNYYGYRNITNGDYRSKSSTGYSNRNTGNKVQYIFRLPQSLVNYKIHIVVLGGGGGGGRSYGGGGGAGGQAYFTNLNSIDLQNIDFDVVVWPRGTGGGLWKTTQNCSGGDTIVSFNSNTLIGYGGYEGRDSNRSSVSGGSYQAISGNSNSGGGNGGSSTNGGSGRAYGGAISTVLQNVNINNQSFWDVLQDNPLAWVSYNSWWWWTNNAGAGGMGSRGGYGGDRWARDGNVGGTGAFIMLIDLNSNTAIM